MFISSLFNYRYNLSNYTDKVSRSLEKKKREQGLSQTKSPKNPGFYGPWIIPNTWETDSEQLFAPGFEN